MARLKSAQRKSLPDSDFAGPGRTYPDEDANHQKEAKIQAARAYHAGRITHAQYDSIIANVNRKQHGGS